MVFDSLARAIDSIRWPETISALAAVTTAVIAFCALQTWKHQDKAKKKAEFLDDLIETSHTYIAEINKPISLLAQIKIGMRAHTPTWENGDPEDLTAKGAIAYIKKYGEIDHKLLTEMQKDLQPSMVKLRSLAAKGQIFEFDNYAACQMAIQWLTWHFDRINALISMIGNPTLNWENSEVLDTLKKVIAIEADDMLDNIRKSNISLLEFVRETYKQIYG